MEVEVLDQGTVNPTEWNPATQVAFSQRLRSLEGKHLSTALADTVTKIRIPMLDKELATFVLGATLQALAGLGLRAETFFPCPLLLRANQELLGYYRLLYGISQKQFVQSGGGLKKVSLR